MASRQMIRTKNKVAKSLSVSRSSASSKTSSRSSASSGQRSVKARQAVLSAPVRTETESVLLMKKLLAASVSTICFARGIFPAECFIEKKLPDNSICKLLANNRNGKPNAKALLLIEMLQGAFEALDKKYLREFKFGICFDKTDPDIVEESYTFAIEYGDDGTPSVSVSSDGIGEHGLKKVSYAMVKESICQLMHRFLFMAESMQPFDTSREPNLSIKLLYYDDRTPLHYEPRGFEPTKLHEFIFDRPINTNAAIGTVGTNFHEMAVGFRSVMAPAEDLGEDD